MNRAFVSRFRYFLVLIAITGCFAALIARLFHLHVWEQEKLQRIVENNRNQLQILQGRRGDIVDIRGNILATTHSVIELGVDPHVLRPEDFSHIPELAELLGVSEDWLRGRFETRVRTVPGPLGPELVDVRWHRLAEAVEEPTYARIREMGIRGVYGNRKYERVYPADSLASHVLGFINKEHVAVAGVERHWDFYLRGQDGWRRSERDGRRRELAQFRSREIPAQSGYNIELTIDWVLQNMVEKELQRIAAEYDPEAATIIVSEPATGSILALGNYPGYDPNTFWRHNVDHHRNRAVADVFEPGSTFKIIPVAAVLNEGLADPSTLFDCSLDVVEYRGRNIRLPGDVSKHEELSVEDILIRSSNRGAAHLGMLLGPEKLYRYVRDFGFGGATGYGPDFEVGGILHPPSRWDGITISRLPMGHAVAATAMQVHFAMTVIANDGILMQPRLVNRIYDRGGETVIHYPPVARQRVIDADVARTVGAMLNKAVSPQGTARRADVPGFGVAGKTGTTRKLVDGRYSNRQHVSSFAGFFPAANPRLAITVVVDDAKTRGTAYGGVVAAPAFHNVAREAIRYLGIASESQEESTVALTYPQ